MRDEIFNYPFITTTANKGNLISVDIGFFDYMNISKKELKTRSIDSSNAYFIPSMLRYSDCLYIDPRFSGVALNYSGLTAVPIKGWKSNTTTYFIYAKDDSPEINSIKDIIYTVKEK